eukprot:CAMPEP_0113330070 /NCGR_PEP_ID=MMETSP0010_2-20120614/21365_1 /TAXON_ID=216773 ORGANISM="Corethron hystrix, Strain 308" /NCGR_SAMPLE_ID=MMETSP0010_2 /ASSEMBLY_ACC=CAM_ASM_000155 /LENGTH=167 /DNA_ID=CAMNT_0000192457 /DNA_START=654 /DNA_END=1158 /DNA_ORIENTATION=- /assembly_acc=CAM_ASM_000155
MAVLAASADVISLVGHFGPAQYLGAALLWNLWGEGGEAKVSPLIEGPAHMFLVLRFRVIVQLEGGIEDTKLETFPVIGIIKVDAYRIALHLGLPWDVQFGFSDGSLVGQKGDMLLIGHVHEEILHMRLSLFLWQWKETGVGGKGHLRLRQKLTTSLKLRVISPMQIL